MHIAQVIAGHRDIGVTMRYKAVYPDEAITAHLAFLARRRALRPTEEYRQPTDAEWQQFLGHFEPRKVSIGTCGRAFGTPCLHEHSCLRCCMHWPDPAQRQRIAEIRDNLIARIAEAEREGWLGAVEGLHISLAGAHDGLIPFGLALTQNSPKSTGARPRPLSTSAYPTHNTRKPHGRKVILSSENTSRSAGKAASVLNASGFRPTARSLSPRPADAGRQAVSALAFPMFRAGAADRAHAAFLPDTAWPVNGTPARLIPGPVLHPGFDAKNCFDTSTAVRLRSSSRSPPDA